MGTSYYFIGIITYPYKYEYGQYRVIFPYVSIWRLPVLRALTKTLLYTPIEEFNVYSLGNWAMSCCVTSDTLLFPLNLQYNSLPIEKAARVPYPPQSMYLILSIFTLLFYWVWILTHSLQDASFVLEEIYIPPLLVEHAIAVNHLLLPSKYGRYNITP